MLSALVLDTQFVAHHVLVSRFNQTSRLEIFANSFPVHQRLAKWFTTLSPKDKAKIVKDVSQLVLSRRTRMCNFLEYKGRHTFFKHLASYNANRNYVEQTRR